MQPHIQAFHDDATSTLTYVVYDAPGGSCAIIDPVLDYDPKSGRTASVSADAVAAFVRAQDLTVVWLLETHAHADHLSGAPYLQGLLETKGQNTDATWQSIVEQEGSVQHLDCLTDEEKTVYRTAFEIDQRWIIELAADRTPYICQSQSLNLFLPADIDKWDLHMLHWTAWERGIKSLYYCRSKSISRAGFAGQLEKKSDAKVAVAKTDYEECLACQ